MGRMRNCLATSFSRRALSNDACGA